MSRIEHVIRSSAERAPAVRATARYVLSGLFLVGVAFIGGARQFEPISGRSHVGWTSLGPLWAYFTSHADVLGEADQMNVAPCRVPGADLDHREIEGPEPGADLGEFLGEFLGEAGVARCRRRRIPCGSGSGWPSSTITSYCDRSGPLRPRPEKC